LVLGRCCTNPTDSQEQSIRHAFFKKIKKGTVPAVHNAVRVPPGCAFYLRTDLENVDKKEELRQKTTGKPRQTSNASSVTIYSG
jgi:hypothetical protein